MLTSALAMIASLLCVNPPEEPAKSKEADPKHGVSHSTEGFPAEPLRVGGDFNAKVEPRGEFWQCGKVLTDEHLPDGYPRPTPPGAIEIKHYPSVRRAEVTMNAQPGRGRDFAFWPLFRHISKRNIAMTSPVEMDFDSALGKASQDSDDRNWRMSFLYRTPGLGETGKDGVVNVVDRPAISVLALGMMGDYWPADLAEKLKTLEAWLAANPEWRASGAARVLAYNGPNIPSSRRWGELQLPIERVPAEEKPKGE